MLLVTLSPVTSLHPIMLEDTVPQLSLLLSMLDSSDDREEKVLQDDSDEVVRSDVEYPLCSISSPKPTSAWASSDHGNVARPGY